MCWEQSKSVLDINLCKKGILLTLKDFGDSVIQHHICEDTQVFRDTIINTVKFRIGEINNHSPFKLLMMFGNHPKSANMGIRAGVLVIGASESITKDLSCKVIFDYFWVKESAFQVLVCALQWPPRVVVTNTKVRSNACKEISSRGFKWICLEGLRPLRHNQGCLYKASCGWH